MKEFDTVTSCCPVPIVIAGGKKLPELDALKDELQRHQAGRQRR
jgi:putative autoinducer-2 (AI-2) aldolase